MNANMPHLDLLRAAVCLAGILSACLCRPAGRNAAPASLPAPRKIIDCGGGGWKEGQVQEPCIFVNPKDHRKLIMFYAGMGLGGGAGCIGKAWADVSDPYTWHEDPKNPLMASDPNSSFEGGSLRLDSVIYNKQLNEYWLYYTGGVGNGVGLATCPAGKDGYSEATTSNVKRYEGNPILTPKGQGRDDGECASQGAVFREKGEWYMFYSYRTGTQALPGVRLAVSHDGKHWNKIAARDLITAAPEQLYLEWHQVYKIGNRYVLLYEGFNGGKRWGAELATSLSLTSGWQKAPQYLIDQTKWPNYSDETMFQVATPAIYRINHKWYMYFQATRPGFYCNQHWSLWCIECDDAIRELSAASAKLAR